MKTLITRLSLIHFLAGLSFIPSVYAEGLDILSNDMVGLVSTFLDPSGRDTAHWSLTSKRWFERLSKNPNKNLMTTSRSSIRQEAEPVLIQSVQHFNKLFSLGYRDLSSIKLSGRLSLEEAQSILFLPEFKHVLRLDLSDHCDHLISLFKYLSLQQDKKLRSLVLSTCPIRIPFLSDTLAFRAISQVLSELEELNLSHTRVDASLLNSLFPNLESTVRLKKLILSESTLRLEELPLDRFQDLEELHLAGHPISPNVVLKLEKLQKLKVLNLASAGGVHYYESTALPALPQLKELNLRSASVSPEAMKTLGLKMPSLETLTYSRVGRPVPFQLEFLQPLKKLRSLSLWGVPLNEANLSIIGSLSDLTELHLGGSRIPLDAIPSSWAGLSRLKKLSLDRISPTGLTIDRILSLQQLTDLALTYPGSETKELNLSQISRLPHLQSLDLSGSPISPKDLQVLSELKELRELRLASCQGMAGNLAFLQDLPLVVLDLSGTSITDQDLNHLKGLPKLRSLNLDHCQKLSRIQPFLSHFRQLHSLSLNLVHLSNASMIGLMNLRNLHELTLSGEIPSVIKMKLRRNNYGLRLSVQPHIPDFD